MVCPALGEAVRGHQIANLIASWKVNVSRASAREVAQSTFGAWAVGLRNVPIKPLGLAFHELVPKTQKGHTLDGDLPGGGGVFEPSECMGGRGSVDGGDVVRCRDGCRA